MLHNKPPYLRFALMAPAGDDAGGGGGSDNMDRGDDHVATDDNDHAELKNKVEKEGLKKEGDKAKDPEDKDDDKGNYDLDTDEGDETDEERAAREAEEAKLEREKRIRIPKWRYDEAQAKAKQRIDALNKRIEELESATTAKKANDQVAQYKAALDDLQDKYEDLVLDGKKNDAKVVRQQIAKMQDDLAEYRAAQKSDEARAAAVDQMKFDVTLARHEAAYPVLNPDSEQFDQDVTEEVADLTESFIARGYNRAAALDRAVKYVMRGTEKQDSKGSQDTKEVIEAKRREEARRKAAEAARKQAPDTKGIGKDSDKMGEKDKGQIDVMRMKQKDFVKLDEDTLAKLRGDELA